MKRSLIAIAAAAALSGCAGLQTAWVMELKMRYATPPEPEQAAPEAPVTPADPKKST